MSGHTARVAAAELLMLTLDKRRTLDEALTKSEALAGLEGSDRGFARAMASAALRELGRIDAGLAPLSDRAFSKLTPEVRALMRIGAVQLWRMDVGPHAGVGETVNAAKAMPAAAAGGGFLNAVLRRASRERPDFETTSPLTIWPDWLQAAFTESLGDSGAKALARAQLVEPELHLTARGDAYAVAEAIGGDVLASGSVRAPKGQIEEMDGYAAGDWWVQDQAAALPTRILAPVTGETIIDLCAAPGGKTLQLAAAGAHVLAVDRSTARLERLKENVSRTGLGAQVIAIAEKAEDWRPDAPVQKLLLDAPCSALGTLRRHPEGAWIKSAGDVARFPVVQARLLQAAKEMVQPGGEIVYCVCTPLKAEGIDVVEAALAAGGLTRRAITREEVAGFEGCLTPQGDVLTVPLGGASHDAFYMARLCVD